MRVLLILLGMLWMKGENPSELIITKQKITVSGQTSFGAFNCDYTQVGLKDTLVLNGDLSVVVEVAAVLHSKYYDYFVLE